MSRIFRAAAGFTLAEIVVATAVVAIGSDGYLRGLYVSNGGEMEPPFPFVPFPS